MSKLREKVKKDYDKKKKLFWEDKEKAPGVFERLLQFTKDRKKEPEKKKNKRY